MKPPFSYYGGKQRLASKIIPLIPKHTVYAEPFCGGATILFKKPWPNVTNKDHYRECINDTNELVINFFRQLRDSGKTLSDMLSVMPYSEAEHRLSKHPENEQDDLMRAYCFYTNIMQSFSNKLNSGWRRGVYGRNEQATWGNNKDLCSYISRMQSVGIACQDALHFIKQYDSPQTFFYCDPPYPNTCQGHYAGYTQDDFKRLIDTLNDCQGSFLLSCYDQPGIPGDWERFEFKSRCSASSKGVVNADRSRSASSEELGNRERTEIVWRRLNRVPVRKEIRALYDSGKFDCFV